MRPIFERAHYRRLRDIPGQLVFDLKCCVQRIRKGYCTKDLWNMDDWFTDVIPDMLEEFDCTRTGFPAYFEEEYFKEHEQELGMTHDELFYGDSPEQRDRSREVSRACSDRWGEILRETARLLRESARDDDISEAHRALSRKKAFSQLEKYLENLWD